MKMSDLKERGQSELETMESDIRRELWKARFSNFTNQLDNTAKLKQLRRRIAQIKTLLTERAQKPAAKQADNQGANQS
jgi:large subunit ribosomal protein L29